MVSKTSSQYIFHHVFFPPKLPHEEDGRAEHDVVLTRLFYEELMNFHPDLAPEQRLQFGRVIEMVKGIVSGEDDTTTPSSKIIKNLRTMKVQDICAIHIEKQNAGMIIRRFEEEYTFETFELSPKNEAHRIYEDGFQEALSQCIESLVRDTPIIVHSKISKAHTTDIEIRDTVDPTLITSMLTECLHAIGRRVVVRCIQKRTRDIVQWKDCLEPWRRSPRYLFLRVCLQIGLTGEEGHEPSHIQYKSFMLFFMCQILNRQLEAQNSREILFIMSMKVQRRLLKLGSALDSDLKSRVQQVLSLVSSCLKKSIPSLPPPPRADISILRPQQGTVLNLQSLGPYIAMMSARGESNLGHKSLEPQCLSGDIKNIRLGLADIELWVADHLPRWLKWYYTSTLDCTVLADLISIYQKTSDRVYKDIAEDQSLKILTLLDLWVALDKCVTSEEPLLKDYRCGFTPELFAPLLLPTKPQMIRLASIERYIADRNAASVDEMPCIFSKINTLNSFSVRYFDKSLRHQHLRDRIMADAVAEHNEKILELNTKLQAFEAWKKADLTSVCEEKEFLVGKRANRRRKLGHKAKRCQKCIAKACAEEIKVAVHEFPLPESELEAKSVVFELDVPTIISSWRDRTYSLLVDTFSSTPRALGSVAYYYFDKSPLKRYVQNSHGRLRVGSQFKPFIVSHYKQKAISLATTENILKTCGLSFNVLDFDGNYGTAIATNFLSLLDIRTSCTMVLAPACAELQYSLESTAHTTNEALARQIHCPNTLTLSGYYQFTSLRSGFRLLWMNILREVESRVLDLNREESFQLMAQAAWQAGPADYIQSIRESHSDLDDEAFGVHLLEALNRLVSSLESNWQGGGAIRIVTMLATRLLSVLSHENVQEDCLHLILRIRIITMTWTRDIVNLLHDCEEENKLQSLELRALELALTCNGTFDVDIHHLKKILESVESRAIFIESLITVHDRSPISIHSLTAVTQMCLRRFDRITHRAERVLRDMVTWQAQGIDTTIQYLWSGYKPGVGWTALKTPNERWLRTRTAESSGQLSLFVDFNILSGELLINGSPLARLPHNYVEHPTYKRLFGKLTFAMQKMLKIIPSTMPGMAFENRKLICEQQINFIMIGNELIVRTRGNGECFEVIPKRILIVDFTDAFVEDYFFMRNNETGIIQLRPVESPWMFPENGWQITNLSQQYYHLTNGSMTAVDVRSRSATAISEILRPIERLCYINMIVNQHSEQLEIRLTRFNLDFYQSDWRLTSKQFRGIFVDEDQNIGTFTGLVNKLVLCNSDKSTRIFIIPDGEISFTPYKDHVKVDISLEPKDFHAYHDYKIDTQLGRLIDNGSLHTRLFKSYLHALTSDIVPDNLTGKTGTEEALEILSSAAVLSFYTLSSREIDLLLKLRALSPKPAYYPKNKKLMQSVSWSQLPTLSQHEGFSTKFECIFTHARSLILFQDKSEKQAYIPEPDTRGALTLIYMAAIRNSFCFVDMFGAEKFTISHDKEYDSRDGNCDMDRRAAIYDIARLVSSWAQDLNVATDLRGIIKSSTRPIIGPDTDSMTVLGYDTRWLDAPSEFLPEHWFAIYQMLTSCNEDRDKYKVMIFLSTLVFSRKIDQVFVHTLLAFATNPSLRYIKLPRYHCFSLSEGFEPNENRLGDIIASAVKSYERSSASIVNRNQSETEHEASIRRQLLYSACRKSAIDMGAEYFMKQWPIEKPIAFEDDKFWAYVDIVEANARVQGLFMSWFRNKEFMEYIRLVQATLYTIPPMKNIIQPWNDYTNHTEEYKSRLTYISLKDLLKNRAPLFFSSSHLFDFNSFLSNIYRSLDALHNIPSFQLESSALAWDFVNYMFGSIENTTMLPRLSKTTILSLIADSYPIKLTQQWKQAIVYFGLAITTLQRLKRLVACRSNKAELLTELSNPGHRGWDPLLHPDWLLLELENGILIRKDQANISSEMIDPSSGANSVMQLNMGLGKSSVIVPLVASALADKTKLCRVVVLRALSRQMRELLVRKLGNMINRRIFFVPISRGLQVNAEGANQLREIYETCMTCCGVLLVQPEHLLSFELMGLEMVLSGDQDAKAVGKVINDTQDWLLKNCRDILDESDEILNVRFELIYTLLADKRLSTLLLTVGC
ncbi:uncharacterized protein EAF01_008738 [Botrytis porri]|uniref:uncharacterized protein n=1 Tax=Botrytis porri TaxID=87229 RepID=UPI0018FFF84D|nr:uncharacterized protein EAF01_008738 [Botrytis porri]KAF7897772.1 hypothetical protein EAF01_008738 [Botrytis porri]